MTTNIESRIEALEARLVPSNPQERTVITIVLVKPDGPSDPVTAYSDWSGHTLQREPDELPAAFQARAEAWVRMVHEHDDPRCLCALFPARSDRRTL